MSLPPELEELIKSLEEVQASPRAVAERVWELKLDIFSVEKPGHERAAKMTKPREWVLNLRDRSIGQIVGELEIVNYGGPRLDPFDVVRVIEKSAYDDVVKERDALVERLVKHEHKLHRLEADIEELLKKVQAILRAEK